MGLDRSRFNFFNSAPDERSQDAVLAYILTAANPEYQDCMPELHGLGKSLPRALVKSYRGREIGSINSVAVGRQWKDIDVWAEVNEDLFLII